MNSKKVFIIGFLFLSLAITACGTPSYRHLKRGNKYLNSGNLARAESEFRKSIQEDTSNPDAHFGLAYVLFRQDKLDQAIEEYQTGMKIEPEDPDSHYYLGLIYNEKNMLDQAREELRLYEKLRRSQKR